MIEDNWVNLVSRPGLALSIALFLVAVVLFVAASGRTGSDYRAGAIGCLIGGGVLLAGWYGSRQQELVVACANGEIRRNFGFRADVHKVVGIIEAAKARRVRARSSVEEAAEDRQQTRE